MAIDARSGDDSASSKLQILDSVPKRISALQFGIQSPQDIVAQSVLTVTDRELYDASSGPGHKRQQTRHGPLDERLGTSGKSGRCETCLQGLKDCNGHFGHVKLALPAFHYGFFKKTIDVLNCVCKECSRILLPEKQRRAELRAVRRPGLDSLRKGAVVRKIAADCRKVKICPYCKALNGPVKKVPNHPIKMIHNKFAIYTNSNAKSKKKPKEMVGFEKSFDEAKKTAPDVDRHLRKAADDLHPLRVLNIFRKIPNMDVELLGMDPDSGGRPEYMIWTHVPAPPVAIRPSVAQESASTEDDITNKLGDIVQMNNLLKAILLKGQPLAKVMELWEFLEIQIAMYIDGNLPGLGRDSQIGRAMRGFCQRLKGKQGRFRGNLSGKRVDFSGRTVISPDPNLGIDEVAVPSRVAMNMTYPEKVTSYNINKLKDCVRRGDKRHPGANFVVKGADGRRIVLRIVSAKGDLEKIASKLEIGDTVERHIHDGDIVLFNRQPSLHKLSILSHRAKVRPWRTFRLNECVCNPYNADFDGDEMNLHVPQTEEARTEAIELMGVKHNLSTPKNGTPIIAAIQDFITGAYLISQKDKFFNRREFMQIVSYMFDGMQVKDPFTGEAHSVEIPPPAIMAPQRLWTGKQVWDVLIKPYRDYPVVVNLDAKGKQFTQPSCGVVGLRPWEIREEHEKLEESLNKKFESMKAKKDIASFRQKLHTALKERWEAKKKDPATHTTPDMGPNDSYLVIRNSEVMCGAMDKATIGDGKKKSVFYVIMRDYGPDYAAAAMNRLAKLSSRWLTEQGFSIGIGDVYPSRLLRQLKDGHVKEAYEKVVSLIDSFNKGKLERAPGCDEETTLENLISGILSEVRRKCGDACFAELSRFNAPLTMAKCGSKGSNLNVSQMVAAVGQQIIGGQRVLDGFQDRTLPHFPKASRDPPAKGFVVNSFFSGLTPTEFIFHAMSGREGLVDTAVKTAETGYMSRRLMKSLEDLSAQYDLTVRNSSGGVVQMKFGDDGLDPVDMEGNAKPVNFDRSFMHAVVSTWDNAERGLQPEEVDQIVQTALSGEKARLRRYGSDGVELPYDDESYHGTDQLESVRNFLRTVESYIADRVKEIVRSQTNSASGDKIFKLSRTALDKFLQLCLRKFEKSKVEAGHAVGAVGAQSIGEPGTQMTLKTFHFAGVAGMSITQGVPRIKEIINASSKISTPVITCALESPYQEIAAKFAKALIQKTYLRDIVNYVEDVWYADGAFVHFRVDWQQVESLGLRIDLETIILAIEKSKTLKALGVEPRASGHSHIKIFVNPADSKETKAKIRAATKAGRPPPLPDLFGAIQNLRRRLPGIVVKGYPDAERAIMKKDDKPDASGREPISVFVEGYGLKACMTTPGINGLHTKTNSVLEVRDVLGVEAARKTIILEISSVMAGMDIDPRHMQLLADVMTYKGDILGITRFGLAKMRDSVLQLASFEKTPDHLFQAAVERRKDEIQGVSECIIMGQSVGLGTGSMQVVRPLGVGWKAEGWKGFKGKGLDARAERRAELRRLVDADAATAVAAAA